MRIKEILRDSVYCFHLAQGRNRCLARVNPRIDILVSINGGDFLTIWKASNFQTRALFHEPFVSLFCSCLRIEPVVYRFHSSGVGRCIVGV